MTYIYIEREKEREFDLNILQVKKVLSCKICVQKNTRFDYYGNNIFYKFSLFTGIIRSII